MLVVLPANAAPGMVLWTKALDGGNVSYTVPPDGTPGKTISVFY
jgi:hypothetical protein